MTAVETVGTGLAAIRAALRTGGIDAWALESRLMMAGALGISAAHVFSHPERVLSDDERGALAEMTHRRLAREPLAYILGQREFWSLPFGVAPATLIPRPETELIVEIVLQCYPDPDASPRILDLGTGSGCILLSLLHERPRAGGVGVDICEDALRVARTNAAALQLASRARFVCGDWTEPLGGTFDVIVANPPYIPTPDLAELMPDVRLFEPRRALDGGTDGLAAYRRIVARLGHFATVNTSLVMEIAPDLAEGVTELVEIGGFDVVAIVDDLGGRARCVVAKHRNNFTRQKGLGNGSLPV